MGIILFILSLFLAYVLTLIGIAYQLVRQTLDFHDKGKKWRYRFNMYFLRLAESVDKFGNVVMAELLNDTLIKKKDIPFGSTKQTISEVMGINVFNLTRTGRFLYWVIDLLDKGHFKRWEPKK